MPNEDHHDEKPLSDVLRARHSEHGKRRGLHGKTARKLHNQRYSPATECGLTSSNTMPCSPFAHPCQRRLLSHFELAGRDASHSLNRDHAWEHVPALLHERAIAPPRVHKRSNGLIETSFALEPVVEVVADAGADESVRQGQRRDRRQLRTDGKIYSLRNGKRPVLFAEPPTEPPVGVRGSLLTPVRVGGSRSSRAFPTVRRPGGAAWDVAQHGGVGRALLEIDLGADCLVSHLSTQGREPPTRTFPQVQRERRRCKADLLGRAHSAGLGRRAQRSAAAARRRLDEEEEEVAELCSVEGRRWNLLKHGHYPGPFWMVLNLKGDQERCRRTGRPFLPAERFVQWVSRFEVHFRCDGGRRWLVLGSFKGNADATSEVAHSLGGLRARYLRIVPLDVVGEGALRVGVYGQVAAAAAVCGAASGAKEAPDPITYTLCSLSEGLNTRYTHRERYTYRGGDRGWSCDMPVSMMGARRLRHLYPIHDLCLEDEEDEEQAVAMWQHEQADVEGQAARPMPTLGDFIEAAASAADERTSVSTSGWDLIDLVGWSDASSSAWSEADHLSCAGSEDGGE